MTSFCAVTGFPVHASGAACCVPRVAWAEPTAGGCAAGTFHGLYSFAATDLGGARRVLRDPDASDDRRRRRPTDLGVVA